jgi:hypothetical protein
LTTDPEHRWRIRDRGDEWRVAFIAEGKRDNTSLRSTCELILGVPPDALQLVLALRSMRRHTRPASPGQHALVRRSNRE